MKTKKQQQLKEKLFEKGLKQCPKCPEPKPLKEFNKSIRAKDGLYTYCKEHLGRYYEEKKVKILKRQKEYNDINKEKIEKHKKEYRARPENKNRIAKYGKEYRNKLENKLKKAKYCKEYNDKPENKKKRKKRQKEYRDKPENKKKANNREKNRRKTDDNFRITLNLRNRIYQALKDNNKSLSTMLLIGCEVDYLMYHLQEQFQPGMSWDNYGLWHMDHIKPCSKFDLSKKSEQLKCFNYTNLQPLWAEDNRRKGNKYE